MSDRGSGTTGPANLTERPARIVVSKVLEVTALFWIIKVLTTGMGETASEYLTHRFDPVVTAGVVLFAVLIAIPAIGHWRFHLNAVVAFWFAYIVTRPLGASFADWVAVPASRGGLDWGTGPVTRSAAADRGLRRVSRPLGS